MEWIQTNYAVILEILLGCIGVGTAVTGLFKGEGAVGVRAVLLKIAHVFSAVAPIDSPGSLSVPLTTIELERP